MSKNDTIIIVGIIVGVLIIYLIINATYIKNHPIPNLPGQSGGSRKRRLKY
jgi:hypothetical protein